MEPDWPALVESHSRAAVDALHKLFNREGSFFTTAEEIRTTSGTTVDAAELLLESLAQRGLLTRRIIVRCGQCDEILDPDAGERVHCPHCTAVLGDTGTTRETYYGLERAPIRDVSWFFILHGMNTTGTWQEELSVLVSRTYRHMVPVAIYKYGIVRPGVLFRSRQSQIVEEVAARLRTFIVEFSKLDNVRDRPDVIAHSFGTFLISEALRRYPDMRIGRLILLGSVIRPDFDWERLFERDQVELVLNHCAGRDLVVPFAQFFVPGSGPSGRFGFDTPRVTNVVAPGFAHSDFFSSVELPRVFESTWEPFFARAKNLLSSSELVFAPVRIWRSKPRLLRLTTRALMIVVVVPIYAVLPQVIVEGVPYLWSMIARRCVGRRTAARTGATIDT